MNPQYAVSVACGNVKGRAKAFPYHQAKLFTRHTTGKGKLVWRFVRNIAPARRSTNVAYTDAVEFARANECLLIRTYGSLHNRPIVDQIELPLAG